MHREDLFLLLSAGAPRALSISQNEKSLWSHVMSNSWSLTWYGDFFNASRKYIVGASLI